MMPGAVHWAKISMIDFQDEVAVVNGLWIYGGQVCC